MTAEPERPARPGFFGLELLDNRYPALHGLRVIAILTVIQIHVTWDFHDHPLLALPDWFADRSFATFMGMDCFFVLSGFLIGSILLRSLDTSGTQQIKRFYLRRMFRTFPSYYIVLTFLVLAFPMTAAQRAHLPYEYTYMTDVAPLGRYNVVMLWGWSLSLEEQFYVLVPLLFVVLRRLPSDRARIVLLALLTASGLVARGLVYLHGAPWKGVQLYEAIYFRPWTRYDTLVAGVLLALVHARHGDRIGAWLKHPGHRALLAVPALGCAWPLFVPDLFGEESRQIVALFRYGTLTSIFYLATVPMLIHGTGPVTRALSLPIWRKLATVGYGVYLVQIPLLDHVFVPLAFAMQRHGAPVGVSWTATFVGTVVLSFAVGYLMHVFIEKPSLRVREWLAA